MPVIMLCYMVNETWWMQLRLQITWVSQKGDCPGGTILITEPCKSRFLWLAAEWEARETWWTRRACYVVAGLRMDRAIREGMRVALRSWEWDSADSPQGNGPQSYSCVKLNATNHLTEPRSASLSRWEPSLARTLMLTLRDPKQRPWLK